MNPTPTEPVRPGPIWVITALTVTGLALLVWATGLFFPTHPAASTAARISSSNPATTAPPPSASAKPGEWAASVPADDPTTAAPSPAQPAPSATASPSARPTSLSAAPMDQGPTPDPADAPAGAPQTIGVAPGSRSGQQAVTIAERFTQAYAAPPEGTTPAQWWAAVAVLLSDQARTDYSGVDPARVPWTRQAGPGRLVPLGDGTTPVVAVQVPTDTGKVTVHLVPETRRGWVVTRVQMPDAR